MNVGIFIGGGGPRSGGSHSFLRAVTSALADVKTSHRLRIVHSGFEGLPEAARALDPIELPRGREPGRYSRFARRVGRVMGRRATTRDEFPIDELGLHFVWFLTQSTVETRLPYAITVWDIAHRLEPAFPEVRTTGWSWDSREEHFHRWLPRAAYVVTGGIAARNDIVRCYGVSPARTRTLPLVAPALAAPDAAGIERPSSPYLFYPAQFWPHKNHVGLLHALKSLRDRHGIRLPLVLSGADKGNLQHVLEVASRLGLDGDATYAGFVTDAQLAALYRDALALVFPSFFGPDNIPPLEALQAGCPVITADVPGAREQLGDAALYVDPRNSDSIAGAIARIHCDEGVQLRRELVERGRERSASRTPQHYAAAMVAVMDEFEAERRCWSFEREYIHT